MRSEIPAVREQLKKLSLQTIARIDPGLALHSGLTPDLEVFAIAVPEFRIFLREDRDAGDAQ